MHPARSEPLASRLAYAAVVATLATADKDVDVSELEDVRLLCKDLDIPDDAVDGIVARARRGDHDDIVVELRRLRESPLRFTVLTDMVVLGFADGRYSMDERRRVRAYATVLGVPDDQVVAIEQRVIERTQERRAIEEVVEAYAEGKDPWPMWANLAAGAAAGVVSTGALFAAMPATADNQFARVTEGLSTLAFGMGPIAGFAAVLALAVLTWAGTAYAISLRIGKRMPSLV